MNLGVIAQLLGHTDVKVTLDYYGTFADADLQKAHMKYSIGDEL
jgi:integrase